MYFCLHVTYAYLETSVLNSESGDLSAATARTAQCLKRGIRCQKLQALSDSPESRRISFEIVSVFWVYKKRTWTRFSVLLFKCYRTGAFALSLFFALPRHWKLSQNRITQEWPDNFRHSNQCGLRPTRFYFKPIHLFILLRIMELHGEVRP